MKIRKDFFLFQSLINKKNRTSLKNLLNKLMEIKIFKIVNFIPKPTPLFFIFYANFNFFLIEIQCQTLRKNI